MLRNLIATSPRYSFAGVEDLNGVPWCSSGPMDPSVNGSDRPYFRRALASGGFAIGDYAVGRGSGVPAIHFAEPYRNHDGGVAGVIVLALSLQWLGQQIAGLDLPAGATASVVDRNGTFLVRSLGGASVAGQPLPADSRFVLLGTAIGVGAVTSLEGRPRLAAYMPPAASPMGLGIGVGIDTSVAFASVTEGNRKGLFLIIAGALLALVLTLVFGRNLISRPVARLLETAELWRAGNLRARTGMRLDSSEFGRLAAAFEDVATALEAREQALNTALESTLDAVVVLDRDWRYTYMNAHAKRMNGGDKVGRIIWEDSPESRNTPLAAALFKALETGEPLQYDTYVIGLRRFLQINAYPSQAGITVFFRDITEERRMAAALRESEALFRAAFEQAAVGMALIDADQETLLRVNDRLCEITGYSREELLDRRFLDLTYSDAPLATRALAAPMLARETTTCAFEDRFRRKDGEIVCVSFVAALLRGADGQPNRLFGIFQDITERKRIEADLVRLTSDLEARVAEEVAARQAAQARAAQAERMQALGQLAGGIAHDFNNVLQAILGAIMLIQRRPDDRASIARFARMATEAADRGASITRRLLGFARRGELRAEPVDLEALLTSLHEILSHTLGAGIEVTVRLSPGLEPALADRGQLETVLVNLATNARDAMPNGGRLSFRADFEQVAPRAPHPAGLVPGGYARLAVSDTGTGMDAATLARSAEPFFTTKAMGTGTGLGLAMAKGFAEQSGGGLHIESAPGHGTTVTIWLPRARPELLAQDRTKGLAHDPPPPVSAGQVLVVDDEELVRNVLAAQLKDAGFAVVAASGGAEAIALLDGGVDVDALVTDLSMPAMDGLAVIHAAHKRRPGLPALLLTGYAGDDSSLAMSGAINGTFSLLRKPVHGAHLIDRLRAMLAARPELS